MVAAGRDFSYNIAYLECPTTPNRGIENKRESRGLSNHPGPRKREIKPLDRQEMAIKADVRGPAKAVLLVLAYRADSKFFDCYPSHELLAKESGFAVATVKRAIAHLIDLGLVATYSRGFKAALRYEIFPRHDSSERAIADSSESPRDSSESCATIAHSELQNRVQRTRFKRTREGDARARNPPRTYKGRCCSDSDPGAARLHRLA